ncbi:hypothetical protein [Actinoplanes sp. NPDC026619]|uniref:hypothetical protein n=1 Tax=Actinoplanes sp. NPDC026619 TaxID=3155798 RepID=UPI0033D9B53C
MAAALALSVLSACESEGQAEKGRVATLTSTAATPSASAAATAQRPRERLDTTPEEFEAMLGPYNKCMKEHGGLLKGDIVTGGNVARPATAKEKEASDEATRICEPQFYPLPPWEKDPANPEARDFARDVVKCLKGKGVEYVEVSDDGISLALGGDQNDAKSIRLGLDLAPECERAVAATMKK